MATRKCKTCQEKLRVEDTHALCWEHIGREKNEEDGVDELPVLSPRPGEDGEIAEAAQDSQGGLCTRQDGGGVETGKEDEGDFGQKSPQASAPSVTNGLGGGIPQQI